MAGGRSGFLPFAIGDIWMILAALIFAVYSILLNRKPKELAVQAFQLSSFLLGLIFLLPLYLWEWVTCPSLQFEAKAILAIFYVGIFAALVAYLLWNKAIQVVGPARTGMIYYSLPLFSGFLAYLVLGEAISSIHFYSALLVVSGIVIANRPPPQQKKTRVG